MVFAEKNFENCICSILVLIVNENATVLHFVVLLIHTKEWTQNWTAIAFCVTDKTCFKNILEKKSSSPC